MDNLTDIFDPMEGSSDDSVDDLDRELTTAGMILQKLASEAGVDLDSLPEGDVADLLTMLHGGEASGTVSEFNNPEPQPQPQIKEASNNMSNPNEPTVADVAVELAKVAAANGIDLDDVSRDEYHEAFESLAQQMSEPGYFEKKAEMEEKVAEADYIGRYMAHAFLDELSGDDGEKIARARWKEEADKRTGKTSPAGGTRRPQESGFAQFAKSEEKMRSEAAGKAERKARTEAARGRIKDYAKKQYRRVAKPVGRAALTLGRAVGVQNRGRAKLVGGALMAAGGAGAGGAAYGAKKLMDKKSLDEAFESDAIAYANALLVENELIDPNSVEIEFSKFAEYSGEDYDEAVELRAQELLEEAGWLE